MRSLTVPVAPTYELPYIPERPDADHPAHGEGSGEMPFSVGVGASGTYTNVTAQNLFFQSDFTPIRGGFDFDRTADLTILGR